MAHYRVTARPYPETLEELKKRIRNREFVVLQPFGKSLNYSLENARVEEGGDWVWEELDYCSPPLKQERAQVLDHYFKIIEVIPVEKGEGWKSIQELPNAL
jgi:hypothetical protein